jgi:hypothetical protein
VQIPAGLSALAGSSVAFAQMCPACYQNAAAQAPGMLQALKTGVLVMVFPTILMFIVIFGMAFRRRNRFNTGPDEETGFTHDPAQGEIPKVAASTFEA